MNAGFRNQVRGTQSGRPANTRRFACINPVSPEMLALAAAQPNGIPRPQDIMTPGQNPMQPVGTCRLAQFIQAVAIIQYILSFGQDDWERIINHKGHGSIVGYFTPAQHAMISIVLQKFAFGLSYEIGKDHPSLLAHGNHLENRGTLEQVNHWSTYLQPLADYVYNFIIPDHHPVRQDGPMWSKNIKNWMKSLRAGHQSGNAHSSGTWRAARPMWSKKYVSQQIRNGSIGYADQDICKGHNLELMVLCHRLFPFRHIVHPARFGSHFVAADEDVSALFDQAVDQAHIFRTLTDSG